MLADDASRAMVYGVGSALTLPGRHVAAVAGTAESFSDAYTLGYSPSLSVAVWVGSAAYNLMSFGSDGVVVAAPAWHAFLGTALDQLGKDDSGTRRRPTCRRRRSAGGRRGSCPAPRPRRRRRPCRPMFHTG
jgi:membrane carboxypeptidase/penicillin-binding protein